MVNVPAILVSPNGTKINGPKQQPAITNAEKTVPICDNFSFKILPLSFYPQQSFFSLKTIFFIQKKRKNK
jgi:hypothetical protein